MLRELRGSPGSHVKCRAGSVSGTPNGLNGAHSAHSQQLHPGSGNPGGWGGCQLWTQALLWQGGSCSTGTQQQIISLYCEDVALCHSVSSSATFLFWGKLLILT